MNTNLKSLGAIALVTLALGCLAAANASATTGGHFIFEAPHTILSGSASGEHTPQFSLHGLGGVVECLNTSFTGTTTSTSTTTEVPVVPTYGTCQTAGSTHGGVSIHMNGCNYVLKIGKHREEDNTISLACPSEKAVVITHPNCTVTVPPQSFTGAAYTTIVENGKHALTVDLTLEGNTQYHGGICIFTGTNHTATLGGGMTLKGANTTDASVGVTAIGSEDPVPNFQFEASHTALTGTQTSASKVTFGLLLGTVECSSVTLDGTTTSVTGKEITVKPAYVGCTGTGREVTTHMNGCAYVVTVTEGGASGLVRIECPVGQAIETTIDKFPEGCTLTIGDQPVVGMVDYKEEGSGSSRDLLLTWTLEGLHYTRDGCEVGGTGNNGTMSGSITLSGEDTSGNPKGIWIE